MRSLFHFPFPAQPPSQQPSPTATVSLQSEMCHRPHPAPMRRQRRSPVLLSAARPLPGPALTGPWPTVTRSQGARHAAPPSLPRAAARSHRAPSPEYRPAAPAPIGLASSASRPSRAVARIASAPLRAAIRIPLCRHRADSALIAPPITTIVRRRRLTRVALRRPHRAHRAPTSASPPPSLSSRCGGPRALAGKNRTVCIPFSPNARKRPPSWQHRPKCMLFEIKMATSSPHASIPGRNRAIRDAWRANLAAKGPFPRRGARNHAWREDVASAARPFRGSGLRPGRTGFAPYGAGLACLPHAPPAISSAFIAAVLHAPRFAVRDPPRGPRTDASRYLRAAPIPPAARTHRVQETSGTTQTTQCGHKNRIPKWGPH